MGEGGDGVGVEVDAVADGGEVVEDYWEGG